MLAGTIFLQLPAICQTDACMPVRKQHTGVGSRLCESVMEANVMCDRPGIAQLRCCPTPSAVWVPTTLVSVAPPQHFCNRWQQLLLHGWQQSYCFQHRAVTGRLRAAVIEPLIPLLLCHS